MLAIDISEWIKKISTFIPLLLFLILPIVLNKLKKNTSPNIDDLCQHLQGIGIKASIAEIGNDKSKIGLGGRFSSQKSEGLIELRNRNVDSLNLVAASNQYGKDYYIDYQVKNSTMVGNRVPRKTKLVRRKNSLFWGRTVDFEWKGDSILAETLNSDYRIKQRLLQGEFESIKGNIWIYPEPKYGYFRIRSSNFLPPRQIFEAIDTVAKHLKSYNLY